MLARCSMASAARWASRGTAEALARVDRRRSRPAARQRHSGGVGSTPHAQRRAISWCSVTCTHIGGRSNTCRRCTPACAAPTRSAPQLRSRRGHPPGGRDRRGVLTENVGRHQRRQLSAVGRDDRRGHRHGKRGLIGGQPAGAGGLRRLGELAQLSGRCRGVGIAVHRGRVLGPHLGVLCLGGRDRRGVLTQDVGGNQRHQAGHGWPQSPVGHRGGERGPIYGSQRWLRFGSSTPSVARPSRALGLVRRLACRLVMAPEPSPG